MRSHRKLAQATEGFDVSLRRRSWILPAAFSLTLLAVFAVAIFYAYSWTTGDVADADLPKVTAAAEPIKVKPDNPGGLEVPHQDIMVLNQNESAANAGAVVERLLPPPESPQPPPVEPEAYVPAAEEDVIAALVATEVLAEDQAAESEQTVAAEAPAAASAEPAPSSDAAATAELVPAPAAAKPETATATQLADAPAPKAGDFVLQLASLGSDDAAVSSWAKLQKAHPDLLGGMTRFSQKADVNGKTYYRLQIGPFPNRATAVDLCAQLKARNQDCLVVKR